MKRIILLIAFASIAFLSYGQMQLSWTNTVDVSGQTIADSVITPPKQVVDGISKISDIGGFGWSCTVSSVGLDTSITVDFGGSNNQIGSDYQYDYYAFEGMQADSLPYTFLEDSLMVITNYDTTYQKTFYSGAEPFPYRRPLTKLSKDSATTGLATFDWLFYLK